MSAGTMTLIYNDRALVARNWASMAILAGATIWGLVEIWRAMTGAADDTGYLFGLGFVGAAAYGGYRLAIDARDIIVRLETDFASGQSVVTLWQPWGQRRLTAPLADLTGWRMYISMRSRLQRSYMLRVHHPANPRPLQIELMPGKTDLDGLRQLAPEAIEDFEVSTGKRRQD